MKFPEHLSISALTKYEECPRCFWMKSIAGLEDKPSPAQALGSEVHQAISSYHKGKVIKVSPDADKLFIAYAERIIPEAIKVTEFEFVVPFVNLATGEELPYKLKGFVDGISNKWLFEHKTSSRYWKMEDIEGDLQATAYAYGYYMTFGELPKGIRFQIIKKNKVPKIQFLETYRTFEDLVNFWEWARKLTDEMEKGNFEPKETRFGYHHYLCSYFREK